MLGFLRRHRHEPEFIGPSPDPDSSPSMVVCSTCSNVAVVTGQVTSWEQEPNRTGRRVRATIRTPYVVTRHRCPVQRAT